jgi:anaerobic ribonucleoside-triphosphate reductase
MIKLSQKDLKEKSDYFYSYMGMKKNNASLSEVDPNANVNNKNIATLGAEYHKDINVQVNRYILGERIGKLFGEETKEEYYRQLSEYEVYSHDESTAGIKPYCVAIDLYPFINEGNIPVGGSSKAPKHLASFCGVYVNLIFLMASQFAGAVADVSMLTYFDYFARKDYGDNYLITHKREIENHLQQLIYTLNDPSVGRGNQAVFYNTSIFDKYYFDSLFGKLVFPDFTSPNWESVNKLQQFFMKWFNQERTRAILTFPVITAAGLTNGDGTFKDKEFKHFITKEMSEGNSFFIYSSDTPDSLASCCRLKNEIKEVNPFAYTLGGTGIATGSKKVFTLNVNRMVQLGHDVREEIRKIHKYLVAFNEILYEELEHGMLPVYDAGYISLDKQYLTVGVNGVVEAAEFLGFEISDNEEYKTWLKELLKAIKEENALASEHYTKELGKKIMINTEFVPAEGLGPRFAKKDKESGLQVNRDCYNSYFYKVEDDTLDIFDKGNLYSKDILDNLDGGSAYHINLAENPSYEVWNMIVDYMTKVGCNYFCWNVMCTCCEDTSCGYINKNTLDHCSKCGNEEVSHATRVIGYLKKITSFSEPRQKEAGLRKYHKPEAV